MPSRLLLVLIVVFIAIISVNAGAIVLVLRSHARVAALPSVVPSVGAQTAQFTAVPAAPSAAPNPPALAPEEGVPVPFSIVSSRNDVLMAGRLRGHFTIRRDTIEVTIAEGEVYFTVHDPSALTFTEIAVSTVSTPNGKPYVLATSPSVPITVLPHADGRYVLRAITLTIPRAAVDDSESARLCALGGITRSSHDTR